MSVTSDTLRRLASLNLSGEQLAGVLEILADDIAVEEARKASQAARKRRQRDNGGTVTGQSRDEAGTVTGQTPAPSLSPPDPPKPTPTPVRDTTRAREDADFEAFWAAYPRKTAKADARKAFSRAAKKTPTTEMLGGLERAKAGWVDANFIPHPATWLNGERWQDEAPPISELRPANVRTGYTQLQPSSRAAGRGIWAEIAAKERASGVG